MEEGAAGQTPGTIGILRAQSQARSEHPQRMNPARHIQDQRRALRVEEGLQEASKDDDDEVPRNLRQGSAENNQAQAGSWTPIAALETLLRAIAAIDAAALDGADLDGEAKLTSTAQPVDDQGTGSREFCKTTS